MVRLLRDGPGTVMLLCDAQVGTVGRDERSCAHQVRRLSFEGLGGTSRDLRQVVVGEVLPGGRAPGCRLRGIGPQRPPELVADSAEAQASCAIVIARPTASSRTR